MLRKNPFIKFPDLVYSVAIKCPDPIDVVCALVPLLSVWGSVDYHLWVITVSLNRRYLRQPRLRSQGSNQVVDQGVIQQANGFPCWEAKCILATCHPCRSTHVKRSGAYGDE